MNDTAATGSPETPDRRRQATTVSVAEAAHALGISHDALRSRLRRGTLDGYKDGDEWRVVLPADRQATGNAPHQQAATGNDLSPLVDLIERQAAELQRLIETSTMWSICARQAEEQLKQLTAGSVAPASSQDSPTIDAQTFRPLQESDEAPTGVWSWMKRLWRG